MLIEAIPDEKVKLMVLMMVKCGLRISEVIKLKIKDINFVDNVIHVIGGKGAKDRNLSLPSDVKEKLEEYLKSREMVEDVEEVFLNKNARAYSN